MANGPVPAPTSVPGTGRKGRTDHDVIVVGASMAGCRTALTLAGHGLFVLLLDKARFPRWKPCAGGITLKARPYLPAPLWDLVEATMHGAYFTFGGEFVTHVRSDNPLGWMIHRESFDEAHLDFVGSHANVEVSLGTSVREVIEGPSGVRLETSRGDLHAPVAVGADGAKSVVSRALPGHDERHLAFAFEGEGQPEESNLRDEAVFDFQRFPGGYGWVFPKRDHYSVGGFIYDRRMPEVRQRYQEFCAENEFLPGFRTERTRGHPVSLGGGMRRLNTRRILLVGDAGDLVDPLTGEGIYFALRSGHLAGEAIARFLKAGVPLDTYGDQVREEIQDDLRYGRILANWFYDHPRISYHLLFRNSLLCQWITQVRAGTRTYKDAFRDLLRMGPFLPFHARFSRRQEMRVEVPSD